MLYRSSEFILKMFVVLVDIMTIFVREVKVNLNVDWELGERQPGSRKCREAGLPQTLPLHLRSLSPL